MKYISEKQPIETRKTIKEQQKAWEQLKFRPTTLDRANKIVEKYYKVHADKLIVKGS